jgi:PAS domain S-box-containing protein
MQRVSSGETELAMTPEDPGPPPRLAAAVSDAAVSRTLEGTITGWNAAAAALFGYTPEEAIGRPVAELVPEDRRGELERLFERLAAGPRSREILAGLLENASEALHWLAPDGTILWANRTELELFGYPRPEYVGRRIADFHADPAVAAEPGAALSEVLAAIGGDIADSVLRWRVEQERKRLADIAQASSDAIIGWDLDGTITSWNPAAETMYGYTAAEAIGKSILMLVPEELHPVWRAETEQVRRGQAHMRVETVRLRKDGGRVDVSLTVSPLRNDRGEVVGAATIARDITERKRAAEMRDLLVRELDHRLKNVLAVVQSIAFLSLRNSTTLEAFQESFDERLRSLARIYDHLARVEWPQIDLRTLAMLSLEPYREAVETGGEGVMLTATEAATLGMVIHELATNAIKHGALSVPGGRVSFTWQEDDAGGGPRLVLRWSETNGPKVVPPSKTGMGTRMIDVSVRHSFGGEVRVDYAASGVSWEILIPRRELDIQRFAGP